MSHENLLEEYKSLYSQSRRDNEKFMQIMLSMKEVIDSMKDTIKNLEDDNQNLRSNLSIIHNHNSLRNRERDEREEREERQERELPNISAYIDIYEQSRQDSWIDNVGSTVLTDNVGIGSSGVGVEPRYSIPPHVRQVYLNNLENNQCYICLNSINNNETMTLTNCGHLFHIDCIRHSRENSNNCPVCRAELNNL